MSPDAVSALVRCLAFVLLFQAAGAAIFAALFSDYLDRSSRGIRRIALVSSLVGLAVIALHLALEASRLTGTFAGAMDMSMQKVVFSSLLAASQQVQMFGLVVVAAGTVAGQSRGRVLAAIGSLIALAGFLLVGHTHTHPWRAVLAPILMIHLLVVAFWFGALLPMCAVVRQESAATAAAILKSFSRMAVLLVPLLAVAGVVLAFAIAHGVPDVREPYGVSIAAKIAGFLLLMGLAAWNKLRLVPDLARGRNSAATTIRVSMSVEYVLIATVLSITSIMTSFYSP